MKALTRQEANNIFEELFANAQRTMFKVEVLQDYSAVDRSPSLEAWLRGDYEESRKLGEQDTSLRAWREKCLASPADITRVHVVTESYTTYVEWEIEVVYKNSLLKSGAEHVLLAKKLDLQSVTLPDGDFWIFDDTAVLQWVYAKDCTVTGAVLYEDFGDIVRFLDLQQAILAVSAKEF